MPVRARVATRQLLTEEREIWSIELRQSLSTPNFTPYTDPVFLNFRRAYIRSHGSYPPEYMNYTKIGFEFMIIIGRAMKTHGVFFQDALYRQGVVTGHLTRRFQFSANRDNIGFPFVYFRNGDLTAIE